VTETSAFYSLALAAELLLRPFYDELSTTTMEPKATPHVEDAVLDAGPQALYEVDDKKQKLIHCIDYWTHRFDDIEPPIFPPLAKGRDIAIAIRNLEPHVAAEHCNFGVPVYFIAAWAIPLGRYSDTRQDVVFGIPSNPFNGTGEAVLPLRTTWSSEITPDDFLIQTQEQLRLLHKHGAIDLSEIAELGAEAECACDFRSTAMIKFCAPGQDMTPHIPLLQAGAPCSLTLTCYTEQGQVAVRASYTAPLELQQVNNLLAQLEHVFRQLIDAKAGRLSDVDPCPPADIAQIQRWNSEPPPRFEEVVHDLFEAQCKLQPQAPAVCSWDGDFTYSELNDLSLRLACHLVGHSVELEQIVPTCFDKSAWAVVSMLAIMRAGGACVNLSPDHPKDRKQKIMQMCSSTVALTTKDYSTDFEGLVQHVIKVDDAFVRSLPPGCTSSLPTVLPSSKAYVLFTSGSTGGRHRSTSNKNKSDKR
jgi:non-ribosomal peptide synthetase component F